MNTIINLCKRNLLSFFRDRAAVFFSLLAVFIIIGLYALFLGDVIVQQVQGFAGNSARFLMDSWIMAGTLAVTSLTSTLGAFGILVDDRDKRILNDFKVAPIKRYHLVSGYVLSSWIIGLIMSVLALFFAEFYIKVQGGSFLGFKTLVIMLGLMALGVFSSTALVAFIVSFFKTLSSFSIASTVVGTLIGFLTGIYIPIGNLPKGVQTVIKLFPPSHLGALYRQIMMQGPFALIDLPSEALTEIKVFFGVTYQVGEKMIPFGANITVVALTGVVFFALALWRLNRKLA